MATEHHQQAGDDQRADDQSHAPVQQLDQWQTVEGQLETAAAERPAGAGGAGATPDYE